MQRARTARRLVAEAPAWFQLAVVAALTFLVYLPTAWFGPHQNTDTWAAVLPAWQLAQHGTLDLQSYDAGIPWRVEVGDAVYTNRFPGVIASAVPFYALLGSPNVPTIYPGAVAAAFWASLAVGCAFLVFRRIAAPRAAVLATLVFAFATPTWTVSADSMWTHGPDQFWLLLSVLLLGASRPAAAGCAAAVTTMIRPHMAVAWAAGAGYLLVRERRWRAVVIFSACTAFGVLLLVLYNGTVFHRFNILGGYRDEHLQPGGVGPLVLVVNIIGSLVSPHRGILVLTPFVWMLLPGLRPAWRAAPSWVRTAAVSGLTYAAVQLYLIRFIGGHGFYSYRTLIETMTFLAPLLLLSYQSWVARTWARRCCFTLLVVLSGSFHAFGAILDQHQIESGNPFREFSGIAVAREVGAIGTTLWVTATVAVCAVVVIKARRRNPSGGDNRVRDELAPAV